MKGTFRVGLSFELEICDAKDEKEAYLQAGYALHRLIQVAEQQSSFLWCEDSKPIVTFTKEK